MSLGLARWLRPPKLGHATILSYPILSMVAVSRALDSNNQRQLMRQFNRPPEATLKRSRSGWLQDGEQRPGGPQQQQQQQHQRQKQEQLTAGRPDDAAAPQQGAAWQLQYDLWHQEEQQQQQQQEGEKRRRQQQVEAFDLTSD